jgi:hypothetical protein
MVAARLIATLIATVGVGGMLGDDIRSTVSPKGGAYMQAPSFTGDP